ncbi:SatD family protein [Microbacterium sp.]|uniref:SatD family protein n=1 Tax=Microbacterium sp. TaxID=51671 RepID=UPI0039E6C713
MSRSVVTIADIVGSRLLEDRSQAQAAIESAIARVDDDLPLARHRLAATVGDEFQGEYATLADALRSLLLVQLALPDGIELRFGVGVGPIEVVASPGGKISDGPGWWAAREAIDRVHRLQDRAVPSARTRVVAGVGEDAVMKTEARMANAYLLVRDEMVGAMSERARRLTYGRCLGRTQRELAAAEGITQPAVSQALAGAGAPAVIAGFSVLGKDDA